jgi:hypothetical protein
MLLGVRDCLISRQQHRLHQSIKPPFNEVWRLDFPRSGLDRCTRVNRSALAHARSHTARPKEKPDGAQHNKKAGGKERKRHNTRKQAGPIRTQPGLRVHSPSRAWYVPRIHPHADHYIHPSHGARGFTNPEAGRSCGSPPFRSAAKPKSMSGKTVDTGWHRRGLFHGSAWKLTDGSRFLHGAASQAHRRCLPPKEKPSPSRPPSGQEK